MSYDVTAEESYNITSNMRPFFTDMLGRSLESLDGVPAKEASRILTVALIKIASMTTRELQEYDADNGWGDWQNSTRFLREIRDDCYHNPQNIVHVSF